MKLILVMVTSLDGRSTKGKSSDIHEWTSKEDGEYFKKILEGAKLFIMGSTTYETVKGTMQHHDKRLRIVITGNPKKYNSEKINGQLEFTDDDPAKLLKRLEKKGFTEGYLVGGAHTNTKFFEEKLITEVWQTLEPKILGQGNGLMGEEETEISLRLLNHEKLNSNGTLLLKYKVL